ncbi:PucR family transcriptional regulator [Corynebacterium comes]|uniref:Carbohydrate diacid transcriptional activator CdaR n=1 Tax=Corynebacterium comes TaxID=2675218 RepID=A0A6B8W1U1_9CORY|nr:helix-turn-helix domain-containing protein [Corynebacterium comes]QGU03600.1 carbohydrate diacid transcriptional activator CdaR [Corynebacterium comes]
MDNHRLPGPSEASGRMADARWRELLHRLHNGDGSIVATTVTKLRETVPGYESVPSEALAASARRNIELSIRTILSGGDPSAEDIPEADALAIERMGQGVPLGSVLSGFRTSMIVILRRLIELAPNFDIPSDQVLECSTLLWSLSDAFSSRATAVYRDREIARVVADSARRLEWIGNAVSEAMETSELMWGAAMYDVPTDVPVRALAAPTSPGSGADVELQLLTWADRAGVRILTAVRSSVIVGIVVGEVDTEAEGPEIAVGLGEPELLERLSRSFATASLAVRAADDVGEGGLVNLEKLSWRLGVHTSPETTHMLRRRYLAPLDAAGAFRDDLLESVQAYLDNRMNIPAAARSIPVHVNTLRYRLRRFMELTGADLGEVDTLIELSWVLASVAKADSGPRGR